MSDSTDPDGEINNDEYSMRDDQRTAMKELERRHEDSPDEWDEPPTDYEDTAARLEELNAKLQSEPSPPNESERPSKIRFSEELVQVAPSPSPPPEDVEDDDQHDNDKPVEVSEEIKEDSPIEWEEEASKNRDAKSMDVSNDSEDISYNGSAGEGGDDGGSLGQQDLSRSAESEGSQTNRSSQEDKPMQNRKSRSEGSARSGSSSADNDSGYQVWQRQKIEQQQREERREFERQKRQKEANENARREREAKLEILNKKLQEQRKLSEERERKRLEKEEADRRRRDEEAQKRREKQPTFEQWLAGKRAQRDREMTYAKAEEREIQALDSARGHTPRQAKRAYEIWLRRKNEQERREALELQQRLRISRLALRRTRRSQELARALSAASSYRYLDYYGYR